MVNRQNEIAKYLLISLAYFLIILLIILPLILIFEGAFNQGFKKFIAAISTYEAKESIKLSLKICIICIPLNVVFGLMAAWCISKFDFIGKNILLTLIEIPFSISPVISGMVYILLYGYGTKFGRFLLEHNIQIIFNTKGMILTTLFVTFPFVARELIALMVAQGKSQEEAAILLGANGFRVFWGITLPNIKWALLNGILLANARALGEYGAVSVISGHIKGLTNTMPLYVESLYNEYNSQGAFAISSLLATFAIISILLKSLIETLIKRRSLS